jgi:hypothetical protein
MSSGTLPILPVKALNERAAIATLCIGMFPQVIHRPFINPLNTYKAENQKSPPRQDWRAFPGRTKISAESTSLPYPACRSVSPRQTQVAF